ncbi:hypothetical protein [Dokdonella sp.]|uniref:hypothetical protein n=1 Tax=Dokdonella sp. TaxID=2291710 RepID=UPI0025C4FBCB|nr:hypothetical protein [Dokdonella sp.]MBX3690422.1 hypothetical protein [Dokdonella sp.]
MIRSLHTLALAAALAVGAPALAAPPDGGAAATKAAANPPSWYHYAWDIPIIKGEYIPINGGTLGSLGLTYTDDANHTFGVSTFYYDAAGTPQTDATGGVITINDDATLRATGVIASTPISYFKMSNGPCRGCADHPRTQTQTSDVGKFEWTGPRSGRYTLNGQTQDMVEAVSGPPLVAPTDFSGRWLLVIRSDFAPATAAPDVFTHHEFVSFVDLVPVTQARTYTVVTSPGQGLVPVGVDLPPPGARLYDVTCTVPATINTPAPCRLDWFLNGSSTEYTLWFDGNNVGRFLGVKRVADTRTVFDYGFEYPRVYGVANTVIGRKAQPAVWDGVYYTIDEFALFRASPAVSAGGTWQPK